MQNHPDPTYLGDAKITLDNWRETIQGLRDDAGEEEDARACRETLNRALQRIRFLARCCEAEEARATRKGSP